jgi:alanyl-tRNA synthetase
VAETLQSSGQSVVSGEDAFFLYATMGFPVDLTQLMAEEKGLTVDMAGFQAKMQEEKDKSREDRKRKGAGDKELVLEAEQTSWLQTHGVDVTDSSLKYVWHHEPAARVVALFLGRGETPDGVGFVERVSSEDGAVGIILDTTSFYPEQGGQIYDTGVLTNTDGTNTLQVDSVQAFGGYVLHIGKMESGQFLVGDTVTCMVDYQRRSRIAPNHTMTHVLNHALRRVLMAGEADGSGLCEQKGSSVDPDKLRFDFSWNGPLSPEQLEEIERIVVEAIKTELPVYSYVAPLEQATRIHALRQVFGERYPDPVRVLSVGQEVEPMLEDPENPSWNGYSIEFCGGTHLTNTREAESFALLEESGIAKGIRRITAVTKDSAAVAWQEARRFEEDLSRAEGLMGEALNAEVKALTNRLGPLTISAIEKERFRKLLGALLERVKKWKKERDAMAAGRANQHIQQAAQEAKDQGVKVVVTRADFGLDAKIGRNALHEATKVHPGGSFFLLSADEDSNSFAIYTGRSNRPGGCGASDCRAM